MIPLDAVHRFVIDIGPKARRPKLGNVTGPRLYGDAGRQQKIMNVLIPTHAPAMVDPLRPFSVAE
jgi:hypothetical protein